MDVYKALINVIGESFVDLAGAMMLQVGLLIVILLAVDFAIRRRVRAVFRYGLWLLVLIKLLLPVSLSSPTGVGYWLPWRTLGTPAGLADSPVARPEPARPARARPGSSPSMVRRRTVRREAPPAAVAPLAARPSMEAAPAEVPSPVPARTAPAARARKVIRTGVPLSWKSFALFAWVAGMMVMAGVVIQRVVYVWRLVRRARPAGDRVHRALLDACERIRVRGSVRVKISSDLAGPAVCGLFRPVILLPAGLSEQLSTRQLQAVLLHELAHIRRRDPWVNLVQTLLQIVYFYSPPVWLANAMIRRLRELAVDEAVLVAMGRASDHYPETLVQVARLSLGRTAVGLRLIGVVESKRALTGRIRHILNRSLPRSARLGVLGMLTIAVVGAVLLPMAGAERPEPARPRPVKPAAAPAGRNIWTGGTVAFRVIERTTGKGIEGVRLEVKYYQGSWNTTRDEQTDADGRCPIKLPDRKLTLLQVYATKKGLVPIRVDWGDGPGEADPPKSYTLSMEPGTTIGGIVRNERGDPISRATVCISCCRTDPAAGANARVNLRERRTRTDDAGRWRADYMPADLSDNLRIILHHPDYVSNSLTIGSPAPIKAMPPLARLRDMTGAMVMKKGIMLTGAVTDETGKPIARASVHGGSSRYSPRYKSVRTDKQGRYRLGPVSEGKVVVTVQARGFAPDLKMLQARTGTKPVDFKLGPGKVLRGRVVGPDGEPVAGVWVTAEDWRGHRSIQWQTKTDAQGRFRWNDAPADEVLMSIGKAGFVMVYDQPMKARGAEYVVKMHRPLRISGKVTDAETGRPVAEFQAVPGVDWKRGGPAKFRRGSAVKSFTDGSYRMQFRGSYPACLVRIEADGYTPAVSGPIDMDEGEVTIDFKLTRGEGPSGVVLTPDGKPAADAIALLCTPNEGASIRNGGKDPSSTASAAGKVTTGPDGRFSFAPQTGRFLIVVLHDAGWAEIAGKDLGAGAVKLIPWSRIEGTLWIGAARGADEQIDLVYGDGFHEPGEPRRYYEHKTRTDASGRFVLGRLKAEEAAVARYARLGPNASGHVQ
ncbi:MAG: M56 family metallopeptidase, partial [Planctomycetota bacterium]